MNEKSIDEFIKDRRPNISKSSIKTYSSILRNLYKKVFDSDKINFDDFEKSKEILDHLKTLEPNKRKTILSALVVITDNKDYRTQMLDDIKDYNKEQAKQEKNETQEQSWVSQDEVNLIFKELEKNAKLLYKKSSLSNSDLQEIQSYIIMALLSGVFIPPRRSKDYVDFKIKNVDKSKDNYIEKNKLIFNSYKTAKTYGQQTIDIPPGLNAILKKWVKVNPTDYLLFDSSLKPLSNVKLNQRINKLFGKKVSVNQLRHTFLSDKYGDLINKKGELAKDFKDMGSSMIQESTYIKK